jgi:penicillin V acylase-like amidase (Ntn superfamily)
VLGGKVEAHHGDSMPVRVLTNDTYADSLAFLKAHQGFGGAAPEPAGTESLFRFVRAARRVKEFAPGPKESAVDGAFGILDNVNSDDRTKWRIVYDIAARRVYFRTFVSPEVRFIEFRPLDFACSAPVKMMDINAKRSLDVTAALVDYTTAANAALLKKVFGALDMLKGFPEPMIGLLALYPETTSCESK